MALSRQTIAAVVTSAVVVIAAPTMAGAKPPSQSKGHGHGAQEQSSGVSVSVNIRLGDDDRQIVRSYYGERCPPGLAKKHNGCLPPGIAKKRYEVGRPVFDGAVVVELPHDIIIQLPPLPRGQGYRIVDGDLVVVALATMIVLDAIGLD